MPSLGPRGWSKQKQGGLVTVSRPSSIILHHDHEQRLRPVLLPRGHHVRCLARSSASRPRRRVGGPASRRRRRFVRIASSHREAHSQETVLLSKTRPDFARPSSRNTDTSSSSSPSSRSSDATDGDLLIPVGGCDDASHESEADCAPTPRRRPPTSTERGSSWNRSLRKQYLMSNIIIINITLY